MRITLDTLVLAIAAINGILFFFLALTKGKKEPVNYYLAFVMLMCSIIFYDEFTRYTPEFFNTYPHLTVIFTFSWFLILPIMFLMLRYLVLGRGLSRWDIIHLIPLLIVNILIDYYQPLSVRIQGLEQNLVRPEPHTAKVIFNSQIIVYLVLSYWLIRNQFSISGIALWQRMSLWLKILGLVLLVYMIASFMIIISYEFRGVFLQKLDFGKTYIFLVVLYGWLYYTIYHPHALTKIIRDLSIWNTHDIYGKSSKPLKLVLNQIVDQGWHLDMQLNVLDLAILLNIPYRKLKDQVHLELGLSLPQLINLLRIREMEQRYATPDYRNFTLVGLAQSVGFTSKSSFYRSFKQFTSISPASYFEELSKSP